MSDQENDDLRKRLKEMQGDTSETGSKNRPRSSSLTFALLLGGAAVIAAIVYVYSQPETDGELPTRQASEFQSEGSSFGNIERPAPREPEQVVEQASESETPEPASEIVNLIRGLQDQIDSLKDQPEEERPAEVDNSALDEMRAELDQVRQEAAERERELQNALQDRDLEIAGLNNEMDLLRLQGDSAPPTGDEALLDQRRQAAAEETRLEQERLQSGMIAIGGGGANSAGAGIDGATGGDTAAQQEAAKLSDDARFVRDAGSPAEVQRAEIIVNPSNTVTQGTMIQAVLETAIDSTLQGPIRGVVTTDVVSYDGSRVLIPRGSKLIGTYSADVDTGQSRLLVAWERIIMPDNQSVRISSFGGDALGRSGTTGKVNSHFLKRFGSAALISTISAIPGIIEDRSRDEGGITISTGGTNDAATGVADALGGATDAAIGKYINMPPTITVAQGTRVSVMVDRDLEIF